MAKDEARRSSPWRAAGLSVIVLDAAKEGVDNHKMILERELETVGLRLNKRPPNITLAQRSGGRRQI